MRDKRDSCWQCNGSGGYIYCNPDNEDDDCYDYDAGHNPSAHAQLHYHKCACKKIMFFFCI